MQLKIQYFYHFFLNSSRKFPKRKNEREKRIEIAIETLHLSLKSFKQKSMKITHTTHTHTRDYASSVYFIHWTWKSAPCKCPCCCCCQQNSNFVIEWNVCMKAVASNLDEIKCDYGRKVDEWQIPNGFASWMIIQRDFDIQMEWIQFHNCCCFFAMQLCRFEETLVSSYENVFIIIYSLQMPNVMWWIRHSMHFSI